MDRIKWAEKKAYSLLEQNNIDTYPVPVEDIAKKLNITIAKDALEDSVSGLLYRTSDNVIIGVNSFHSETRQRFTIAHELGHFYMQHEGDPIHIDSQVNFRMTTSTPNKDIREIEANAFAAALLMPEPLIKKAWNDISGSIDLSHDSEGNSNEVKKLASIFNVSQQALLVRLSKLGLIY
ncbi:ImmA/IrrE family metallo-endopeptidase [Paenibacillus albus]|uniref:ImmA/IrrE family metallo-endopeptidase n=1 Tax=Paenibacillus albus TaxID=2495582 RepID=A0A3Q8X5W8_9BACL|nr:ImmA/IrrE family metallo-endopeptidase [Paenibacillus albus]AZN40401.1 ImmA/IrrE family metallo-endopeptidase [Paenibacillus albus]